MTPEEIAEANETIVAKPVAPDQSFIVREIRAESVLLVLPVAHAEALSACANVGLEGAPTDVGDLAWASVSKLDEAVRLAKESRVDERADRAVETISRIVDEVNAAEADEQRAAANDDPRGERDR